MFATTGRGSYSWRKRERAAGAHARFPTIRLRLVVAACRSVVLWVPGLQIRHCESPHALASGAGSCCLAEHMNAACRRRDACHSSHGAKGERTDASEAHEKSSSPVPATVCPKSAAAAAAADLHVMNRTWRQCGDLMYASNAPLRVRGRPMRQQARACHTATGHWQHQEGAKYLNVESKCEYTSETRANSYQSSQTCTFAPRHRHGKALRLLASPTRDPWRR